jgi:hypothetical protein
MEDATTITKEYKRRLKCPTNFSGVHLPFEKILY